MIQNQSDFFEPEKKEQPKASQYTRLQFINSLKNMQIPKCYWNCTLSQIPDKCPHKKEIHNYIRSFDRALKNGYGLLLYGDHLTGKSGIAAIILKALLLEKGFFGIWLHADDLFKYFIHDESFGYDGTYMEKILQRPLVVIDGFVMSQKSTTRQDYVEKLVSRRRESMKSVIITTHHTPKQIQSYMPSLYAKMYGVISPVKVEGHIFHINTR